MTDSRYPQLGFIGAGNMASALVGGLLAQGWPASHLWLSDSNAAQLAVHAERGCKTVTDNAVLAGSVDLLVLSVKPQVMADVLRTIAPVVQARQPLVLSIAAGIPSDSLARWLGGNLAVVRAMPNTPALVQTGATGLFANARVSDAQRRLAEQVLGAVGMTLWVEQEDLIDAVTTMVAA